MGCFAFPNVFLVLVVGDRYVTCMITPHVIVVLLLLLLLHIAMVGSIKVQIVTYNTGNTKPRDTDSLLPLLGLKQDPDIVSVG